eukprot:13254611-Alexandrium_andersonii.AAC.1
MDTQGSHGDVCVGAIRGFSSKLGIAGGVKARPPVFLPGLGVAASHVARGSCPDIARLSNAIRRCAALMLLSTQHAAPWTERHPQDNMGGKRCATCGSATRTT